jgi:3-oxoacyl-[acyl-carrier protein] reductase
VKTDLIKSVPPEKIQNIIDRLALKRLATFRDIANVIDFFIREESDYITGQTIYLGGS